MKQDTRGPNDLEERIEYLTNQNEFLKKKLRESVDKNKILEEEYDKLLEENNNFRTRCGMKEKSCDIFRRI